MSLKTNMNTYEKEMNKFWKSCCAGIWSGFVAPPEYWVREIKHKEYRKEEGISFFGKPRMYPPILTIVCGMYEEENKIVVDKNINKILKIYGIDFKFSDKFLEALRN